MLIAVNKLMQSYECKILKVVHSNGSKPKSFTLAACDVDVYPYTYPYHTLFQETLKKLINHHRDTDSKVKKSLFGETQLSHKKDEITMSSDDRLILDKLLSMFENNRVVADRLRRKLDSKQESVYAVQLAHHLLKPLSKCEVYKIDHHTKTQLEECACCHDPIDGGEYTDTSMGHEMVWHGSTDILMGDEVIITVSNDEAEATTAETNPKSSFGVNSSFEIKGDVGLQRYKEQIIAETVVFSFLQNKEKKCTIPTLIPTIAISKREILILFYDAHHDILLESDAMKLYYKDGFNPHTLLALWLAINYPITCSGLTTGIVGTKFTSDFLKYFPEDIKSKYKNELRFGNCAKSLEAEDDAFVQSSLDRSKPFQGGSYLDEEDIQYAFKKSKELIIG